MCGPWANEKEACRDRREQHDGHAGEKKQLEVPGASFRPEPHQRRSMQERFRHCAELPDFWNRSLQPERSVDDVVFPENGEQREGAHDPGDGKSQPTPWSIPPIDEPQQPQRDEDRKEEKEIAVRQRLQQPCTCKDDEPAVSSCGHVGVHAEKGEGHPVCREHLDVRELAGAIWREPEGEACADTGQRGSCQALDEQITKESREGVCQQEADVVCCQDARACELQGSRKDAQPEQMLGECHGPGHRPHHWRVPPLLGQRHRLRVPPQDPDVEERIPGIVRHARCQVDGDRPGPDDREDEETGEDEKRPTAQGPGLLEDLTVTHGTKLLGDRRSAFVQAFRSHSHDWSGCSSERRPPTADCRRYCPPPVPRPPVGVGFGRGLRGSTCSRLAVWYTNDATMTAFFRMSSS